MILNGRYFIDDPESGYYETTKEDYETYHANIKAFTDRYILPRVNKDKVRTGIIIIASSMGDENASNDFKKLWE